MPHFITSLTHRAGEYETTITSLRYARDEDAAIRSALEGQYHRAIGDGARWDLTADGRVHGVYDCNEELRCGICHAEPVLPEDVPILSKYLTVFS